MSTALPPTDRDFLAYQRLVIDAASTRQVAQELNISQTRVRQVVRRVFDWLQQNLPDETEQTQAADLRLARYIAADRLERYYVQANQHWEQTGHTKFANLVLRILQAQTKTPALSGTIESLFLDATLGPLPNVVPSGPEGTDAQSTLHPPAVYPPSTVPSPTSRSESGHPHGGSAASSSPPPLRDCSPTHVSPAPEHKTTTSPPTLSPTDETPSDNPPPAQSATRRAFLSPAHLREGEAPAEPASAITELKITPESLAFTPRQEKHSSRRDRRRLRRLASTK